MISRGDVYRVDLEPTRGAEQGKVRPCVVIATTVTARTAERLGRGLITVVPATSNVSRVLSFQVFVPGGTSGFVDDSKLQVEQVRSVDWTRFRGRVGALPPSTLRQLEAALRLHLSL